MFSLQSENEIQELSGRLHDYMHRLRDIKTGNLHLEVANFNKSSGAMEQEIRNLRSFYEKEMGKLRTEIQSASAELAKSELAKKKVEKYSADVLDQIECKLNENAKLEDGVAQLRVAIQEKETQIAEYNLKRSQQDTNQDRRCTSASQLSKAVKENKNLKAKLEEECESNTRLQETIQQLEHQTQFNNDVAEQQISDLQARLGAASSAILTLEGKVRHISRPEHDQHVAEMIAAIKETSERELFKYKCEAEATFSRNITSLKCQMETDRKMHESVTNENRRLIDCIEELNTKIRNLQGEVTHLDHVKVAAEENLNMERDRVTRQTEALQTKLDEQQQNLLEKMKELNIVKCQNLPLKAEVEGMRALINEEKERMCMEMRNGPTDHERLPQPYQYPSSRPQAHDLSDTYSYPPRKVDKREPIIPTRIASKPTTPLSVHPATPVPIDPGSYIPATIAEGFPIAAPAVVPGMPDGTDAKLGYELSPTPLKSSSQELHQHKAKKTRIQSAPASTSHHISRQRHMTNQQLGEGKSYFDELFKKKSNYPRVNSAGQAKHVRLEAEAAPKSSLGVLTIHEVSQDGRFVMLHNTASVTDMEIGGFSIRQNVSGVPVTEFKFPGRMIFRAGTFITVFSGACSAELHQPPAQFVREDCDRWGTGPGCTTILCNAKGKAVAWVNAQHPYSMMTAEELANAEISGSESNITHRLPVQCRSQYSSEDGSQTDLQRPLYLKRDEHIQHQSQNPNKKKSPNRPNTSSVLQYPQSTAAVMKKKLTEKSGFVSSV